MGLLQPHVRHSGGNRETDLTGKMQNPVLIFLAIAIIIVAMAIFLTRIFKKTIQRDKALDDTNGNPDDARGNATWVGIHKAEDDPLDH